MQVDTDFSENAMKSFQGLEMLVDLLGQEKTSWRVALLS
jgi:hypothetical protein